MNQRGRAAPDGVDRQTDCSLADRLCNLRNGSGVILEDNVPSSLFDFVDAMAIPHKTATYTNLRKVVDLPAPKESTSQSETRGRRPRRADKPKAD